AMRAKIVGLQATGYRLRATGYGPLAAGADSESGYRLRDADSEPEDRLRDSDSEPEVRSLEPGALRHSCDSIGSQRSRRASATRFKLAPGSLSSVASWSCHLSFPASSCVTRQAWASERMRANSSAACLASAGSETSTPCSQLSELERGSRLNEPTNSC